jgi:hypothetical protein
MDDQPLVVRYPHGSITLTEQELVIVVTGTTGGFLTKKQTWRHEFRIPRERCSITIDGREVTAYENDVAVQAVGPCELSEALTELGRSLPRHPRTLADMLEGARRAMAAANPAGPPTPTHGQCAHCGAHAQPIGQACRYCGSTERRL